MNTEYDELIAYLPARIRTLDHAEDHGGEILMFTTRVPRRMASESQMRVEERFELWMTKRRRQGANLIKLVEDRPAYESRARAVLGLKADAETVFDLSAWLAFADREHGCMHWRLLFEAWKCMEVQLDAYEREESEGWGMKC